MILGNLAKSVVVAGEATVLTNATASYGPFDISGCGHVVIKAIHPPAVATNSSAKWQALAVYVGDTTNFTSATAVVGLVGTTEATASTSQFFLGVHNDTSYASITRLSIGSNRAKYAFVQANPPGATSYRRVAIVCDGYHSGQAPNTASEAGCAAVAHGVLSGGNV